MKSLRVTRALAAAGITAAAIITPIVTATPASALGYRGCLDYVRDHGYVVGPKVKAACNQKAVHLPLGWAANPLCIQGLVEIGVKWDVAQPACERAH
jgi:hypothetical protein